ncbi:MAG: rhomboid family intramembrane serine protease [Nocardioides sp.]|nr:rhomboid family intramembrane serine protease [Nocardioides sp.]
MRRPTLLRAGLWSIGFVAFLWILEIIDTATGHQLDKLGIRPRSETGLIGIVFAPVLHFGWAHLEGNTLPALVLSFFVLVSGIGRGIGATAIIWLVGGIGVWLIAPAGTVTGGASILIFGWLVYLIVRGLFSRRIGQIVLGVVFFLLYGGLLLGMLPGQEGVSWQGHLFGAIGGGIAAWLLNDPSQKAEKKVVGPLKA